ncbi:MAG: hypothetical protein IKN07_02410, partial [Lachnospiraceae bacterium]|nr:hypothetical protein [Lachnospiraceae bacterium]
AFLNEALYVYVFRNNSTVTSKLGTHILEHPAVQLQLLEYCLSRPDVFNVYRNVIGLYFLWSFYCETLCFAYENHGAVIPLAYYNQMQAIILKVFPDWKDNPELKGVEQRVRGVLSNIDHQVNSQEELDELIQRVGKSLA